MHNNLNWDEFADATVRLLVQPEKDDPVLIIADTSNNIVLAESFLAAAIRYGADAQLIIKKRYPAHTASLPGPILSEAILASKKILSLCGGIVRAPATIEARSKGTQLLSTGVEGIEDYVIRALLDVDFHGMLKNADIVEKLWNATKVCQVTSPDGTDVTFELAPRTCVKGDGAITEEGEVDFYPGAQVSIAPVEETINGRIVIDASDSVNGVVHQPYTFTMTNGIITSVDGGSEADTMRSWLENTNDDTIYKLCHFSIGLNPQAGISGNMIEDERKLTAIDFGFGYQDPSFGGTVGLSPYHMDIMLSAPTVILDGKEMSGDGSFSSGMGFVDV